MESLVEFAVADTLATTAPSFWAALCLWRGRSWGLPLAFLAGGGYVHGMAVLLARTAGGKLRGAMPLVATYFVVASAGICMVLWRRRYLLHG